MHLPNRPFSYRETPEDLDSLRQLLTSHALPYWWPRSSPLSPAPATPAGGSLLTPNTPPPPPSPPLVPTHLHILNLACGRSDETGLLKSLFSPPGVETHFTGIDIRPAELDEATARWSSRDNHTSFLSLDATKLPLLQQIPSPTHLAFFRHQNFWNGPKLWTQLFDHALHHLDPTGLLIITSYFDKEHLLALTALQELGAQLLVTAKNPTSRPIPQTPGKSVDRHLAVFSIKS